MVAPRWVQGMCSTKASCLPQINSFLGDTEGHVCSAVEALHPNLIVTVKPVATSTESHDGSSLTPFTAMSAAIWQVTLATMAGSDEGVKCSRNATCRCPDCLASSASFSLADLKAITSTINYGKGILSAVESQ